MQMVNTFTAQHGARSVHALCTQVTGAILNIGGIS